MTKLVIVESPAKARTIGGYLGAGYAVEASIGHIRDLPQPSELPADMKKGPFGKFSVDVDNGFEPYYVVDSDKKKIVAELRRLLKSSDELLLATDEDREGEAIAWHLYEVLKPKVPVKRMAFHEITPEAIARALDNPRQIDMKLVDAQESRRILDRLVGYEVSPLLWRKVAPGLSAGRVQSVATRLVVQRERERMAFQAAFYWDVTATFVKGAEGFDAKLVSVDGTRIATGKDFDDRGALVKKDARALGQAEAEAIAGAVADAAATVASVESKPYTRRPAPPFTTSTLQQEASRKLRMGARDAMRTAQALYENGYITYMRTDSTNLSDQAVEAARTQIGEIFGEDYLPAKPRLYSTTSKGAQEAHEAIRPAGDHFRTPLSSPRSTTANSPCTSSSGSGPSPRRWPTPAAGRPPCGWTSPSAGRPGRRPSSSPPPGRSSPSPASWPPTRNPATPSATRTAPRTPASPTSSATKASESPRRTPTATRPSPRRGTRRPRS